MTFASIDSAELERIKGLARERSAGDAQAFDNHLYAMLFNRDGGVWPDKPLPSVWERGDDGEWVRLKRRMRRREWIERYFPIRDETGGIVSLKLRPAQRRFEAYVLRMERAGLPVRIQILKARQQGFSSYAQGFMFERVCRGTHVRGLIVANNNQLSAALLSIARIARSEMVKRIDARDGRVCWRFQMRSSAATANEWAEPISGQIHITSAEAADPGRGGTRSMLHMSETAAWPSASEKYAAVMPSLPTLPGTYAFDESTAQGDKGRFRDDFWRAWRERDRPLSDRQNPWLATFFAWYEHPLYAWTCSYGAGRKIPAVLQDEILGTLDTEEKWLMRQKFLRRWRDDDPWIQVENDWIEELVIEGHRKNARIVGTKMMRPRAPWRWRRLCVGWQAVTIDQLAWRRAKIADKGFGGDEDTFNQEYPSRPEVAFLASGRPAFDVAAIDRALARKRSPVFRGAIAKLDQPVLKD